MRTALFVLLIAASIQGSLSAQTVRQADAGVPLVFTTLDPPNGSNTIAERINRNGVIVGYSIINGVVSGFQYDGSSYTIISYPGATGTYLFGINSSGEETGFYYDSGGTTPHPFLLATDGTYTAVTLPVPTTFVQPEQINDNSQLIGFFGDLNNSEHGFFQSGSVFRQIDYPNAAVTSALDINDHNQIVGQQWTTVNCPCNGYLLSKGVFTAIGVPGTTFAEATGINNAGLIVGSYTFGGAWHGLVWKKGKYVTFDFPGSTFTRPFSINDSNQIVGNYYDSAGVSHGFLVQPAKGNSWDSVLAP
jgi:hypothetical protein